MAKLPKWLSYQKDGTFKIDPDVAYPLVFKALGVKDVDQYWVETAYQCAKLATQQLISGSDLDPTKRSGKDRMAIVIVIDSSGGRKDRWALSNFENGRGIGAATKGLEAKNNYGRVAGALLGA